MGDGDMCNLFRGEGGFGDSIESDVIYSDCRVLSLSISI